MSPRHNIPHQPDAHAGQHGAFPHPADPVLEEVSRKATELERRTRALEAENTQLRREHTKAMLAAAQAQDALKKSHATGWEEPRGYGEAPSPESRAAAPAVNDPAELPDRRARPEQATPSEPMPRADAPSPDARDSSALGSLTIAACLIAMTVNYAILLRYLLGGWLAGFAWPSF